MKRAIFKWLPCLVLMSACTSTGEQDFSGWTLIKKSQTKEGDPLFSSFGLVSYSVYLNPLLDESVKSGIAKKINSKAAIVVHSNNEHDIKKPVLIGYLEKVQGDSGRGIWEVSAIDSNGKPFTREQVTSTCLSCHSHQDDAILLGKY